MPIVYLSSAAWVLPDRYLGVLTESPYVVNGSFNVTNHGNGTCTTQWYWAHNSGGKSCVSEGGLYTWNETGNVITIGSGSANYYWFQGQKSPHGDKIAGDVLNPTEKVGTWSAVLNGPTGPLCIPPTPPPPTPPPAPTPSHPAPSNIGPITWWFDIDSNWEANLAAIKAHPKAFQVVQPGYSGAFGSADAKLPLDDRVWMWWGHDLAIAKWRDPLQELGLKIKPYVIDTSYSAQMHKVWANQTKWIQDAVAIALHYKFDGWFIDYEPEYPSVGPDESKQYSEFLDAFAKEMHKKGLKLSFYVTGTCEYCQTCNLLPHFYASRNACGARSCVMIVRPPWVVLLCRPLCIVPPLSFAGDPTSSNYALFAETAVDELHSGLMYAGDEWAQCTHLVNDVRAARNESTRAAGVGLGPYEPNWTEQTVNQTMNRLRSELQVSNLLVFRLLQKPPQKIPTKGEANTPWPPSFWWGALEEWGAPQ
jgi:hypothetical protein